MSAASLDRRHFIVGERVRLLPHDDYLPPIGAVGIIIEPEDWDEDYGVHFYAFPCPNPPGTHWYCHWSQIESIDGDLQTMPTAELLEATA